MLISLSAKVEILRASFPHAIKQMALYRILVCTEPFAMLWHVLTSHDIQNGQLQGDEFPTETK